MMPDRKAQSPYTQLRRALYAHSQGRVNWSVIAKAFGIRRSEFCAMEYGRAHPGRLHQLDIWRELGATEDQINWLTRKIIAGLPAPARAIVLENPRSPQAQDILLGHEIWVEVGEQAAAVSAHPSGDCCILKSPGREFRLVTRPGEARALAQALLAAAELAESFQSQNKGRTA